jgi:hypothetical protein
VKGARASNAGIAFNASATMVVKRQKAMKRAATDPDI